MSSRRQIIIPLIVVIDRLHYMILGRLYDIAPWPHPWPWPWSFKARVWNAISQEWDGWLTWNEKDVSHQFMTMILTSVTMVGWADVLDSERGDFRHQRSVDISCVVFTSTKLTLFGAQKYNLLLQPMYYFLYIDNFKPQSIVWTPKTHPFELVPLWTHIISCQVFRPGIMVSGILRPHL